MALKTYHEKRDFGRTPEPKGKEHKQTGFSFIVQKHAATRLHYDFRLELEGVLKSWAVPKGPSYDPREKRLAVHVEDHPVEYGSFEGIIPKDEYGGGTVMVWDRGTWIPLDEDPVASYRKGIMKFRLEGQKLRGAWTLIRMKPKPDEDDSKENWLLIKERDEFVRPLSEFDVTKAMTESAISGRSLDEIAADKDDVWHSRGVGFDVDVIKQSPGARKGKLPAFVEPQLATLVDEIPRGGSWIFEIKLDGYRELCRIDDRDIRFISRNAKDWSSRFPSLTSGVRLLPVRSALLDGEIVVLLPDGTTSFQGLQNALSGDSKARLFYYVFDVLYLEGYDLTKVHLSDRKKILRRLLSPLTADSPIRLSDHFEGGGDAFLNEACKHSLEGVICKRSDRPYVSGRTREWLKIKCLKRQEFVVVGFTDPSGGRKGLGALLLGVHDEERNLVFAGRVGTGFTERSLKELKSKLSELEVDKPAISSPPKGAAARGVHWITPKLVAEVAFSEWTQDGQLRHPSFQGLREDKKPSEIVREKAAPLESASSTPSPGKKSESRAKVKKVEKKTEFAGVTLTHPDRLVYPEAGITKRALAEYYEAAEQWILPHIEDRPLTLIRCPNGWSGECFFQKHLDKKSPPSVKPVPVEEDGEEKYYIAVDSPAGLMYFVQMGVLEFHPWGAKIDNLDRPDRMIFDLDPDPSVAWPKVIETARLLREFLAMLELKAYVKTTGGKGLHVVAPLQRRNDWAEVKGFSRAIVEKLVEVQPKSYTSNALKAERTGRIYLDTLRNARGANAVAAYSTRAKPGGPISVPVTWEELESGIHSDTFNLTNISERLRRSEDPWEDFDKVQQSITAKMKKRVGMKG